MEGWIPPPANECHHDGKVRSLERAPRPDKVIGFGRSPDSRVDAWPGLPIPSGTVTWSGFALRLQLRGQSRS